MRNTVSSCRWKAPTVLPALVASAAVAAFAALPASVDAQADAPVEESGSLARPLLYHFQHGALREAAFQYDQDIQALIANPRQAGQPVSRLFMRAAMRYRQDADDIDAEAFTDEISAYMSQISFDTLRRNGYTIHIIGMPPPENAPEAYFTAIVYRNDEPLAAGEPAPSTRYITFERANAEGRVFALGEWDVDGEHTTHGFGDREPTIRDFIANVYALLGIVTPTSVQDLDLMRWLDDYGAAWEARDPEQAAMLFTEDASYRETPYDEPFVGRDAIREYWEGVTADQEDIDFEAEILSISGMTAVARWSARFRSVPADAPVELNGVFVLEFAESGLVSSLREWWHLR